MASFASFQASSMKETARGMYDRASLYTEVVVGRNDSYPTFAMKAVKALQLEDGKEFKLFKLNGALIIDQNIGVRGLSKSWTIGNYLSILASPQPNKDWCWHHQCSSGQRY